jgi:hypothetical protein
VTLDFEGLMADLGAAPAGSVFIFHACAHNPTGMVTVNPYRGETAAVNCGHLALDRCGPVSGPVACC